MALFSDCPIFSPCLQQMWAEPPSCERVQCVSSHAAFLWIHVDFYWYKQTQHATHNVQCVTCMCATGNKSPAPNLKHQSAVHCHWEAFASDARTERFYSDPLPRVKMWLSFWKKKKTVEKKPKRTWQHDQKWLISDIVHCVAANYNIVEPRIWIVKEASLDFWSALCRCS